MKNSNTKKNYFLFSLRILILSAAVLLIYYNINLEKNIFLSFGKININYFIFVYILILFLTHLQIFVQLESFYQLKMKKIGFKKYSRIFFNSQIISFILPHSGAFYKAYQLKNYNLSYKDFIGINLLLAWFYLFYYMIFYSFEVLIFGKNIFNNYYLIVFGLGIIFSLFIFGLPFIYKKFINLNFKNILISKIYNAITYIAMLPINIKNINFYKFLSFCGLINHILSFVVIYLLFLALDIKINFSIIIIFFIVNSFLDQIPITPKNLAISELVFGLVSVNVGFTFEFGVIIKLILRLFFFINLVTLTILYNIIDLKNNEH